MVRLKSRALQVLLQGNFLFHVVSHNPESLSVFIFKHHQRSVGSGLGCNGYAATQLSPMATEQQVFHRCLVVCYAALHVLFPRLSAHHGAILVSCISPVGHGRSHVIKQDVLTKPGRHLLLYPAYNDFGNLRFQFLIGLTPYVISLAVFLGKPVLILVHQGGHK